MEKINFGLEIHQQLNTHKLFCNCDFYSGQETDFSILRQMRASAGEGGAVDIAALEETKTKKFIKYIAKKDKICLVELDDEPPHLPNREAMIYSAKIAKAFGMKVRKNVIFMRKIIIDGSNVSGFQRTALLATNGKIEVSFGNVGISNLFIEEDAAQIIGKDNGKRVFSLSRLGVPLIEITTEMFSATPSQIKGVAEKIGSVLRMSGFVRRGLGTIRQDINISVGDGKRVEIKGAQDLSQIEKIIGVEIARQKVLRNNLKSEVRQVIPDSTTRALRPISTRSRMYPETDIPIFTFSNEELADIQQYFLEDPETKHNRFKLLGLSDDLASQIIKSKDLFDFEDAIARFKNIEPKKIAEVFVNAKRDAQRKIEKDVISNNISCEKRQQIDNKYVLDVLELLDKKKIVFPAIVEILVKGNHQKFEKITGENLEKEVKKIMEKSKGKDETIMIKILMGEFRLRADFKDVLNIYNKFHQKI
ncbi:MAG: hypothetical protein COW47_01525 [Candidatus Huberarchaeum crystalense]|uniref:Aspartyl/Glutamyl-tRNA(Gln) amidotransferase subunit B/E catalytic domain-containing protein n=1 Tax=Huberarchaeum crystalense TaxID=2014257 RepID=A0A2G9LIR7_HUBC1|nr:hypothetical protein [archaeon]OIP20129.1 MAG: hypothetical protein AUJ91_02080 [archaeon CG2_30_31_98]PIN66429.1 MAG: hypothetical protein COW69_02425 [Candidatus Huberarchaeum crystalense]NCS98484.1 hypothetical protein [archaeon]PIV13576.1 MAG: hypothetical protein COS45_02150 [Candidatus Huberarchaeum crystalense]